MLEFITGQGHIADDVPAIVKASNCPKSAPKTAEVQHAAILPKEWMDRRNSGGVIRSRIGIRKSGDLAALVYILAKAVGATQSAEVTHEPVFPQKRPRLG